MVQLRRPSQKSPKWQRRSRRRKRRTRRRRSESPDGPDGSHAVLALGPAAHHRSTVIITNSITVIITTLIVISFALGYHNRAPRSRTRRGGAPLHCSPPGVGKMQGPRTRCTVSWFATYCFVKTPCPITQLCVSAHHTRLFLHCASHGLTCQFTSSDVQGVSCKTNWLSCSWPFVPIKRV